MIVYGYKIENFLKLSSDAAEELDELYPGSVQLVTGYSVGAYEPEAAVLGVQLDSTSCLFNPVDVSKIKLKPSPDQWQALENTMAALSVNTRDEIIGSPAVYIFENSDD